MTPAPATLRLPVVLIGAALPAGLLGGLEAVLVLWGAGDPRLDAAVLRFALLGYPVAGAVLGLALWPVARGLGRRTGRALFPWPLGADADARSLLRAWVASNGLLAVIWIGAIDLLRMQLQAPPGSATGALVLAAFVAGALALGWLVVPRLARSGRDCSGAAAHAGWQVPAVMLAALLLAGLVLPAVLQGVVYDVAELPRRTAWFHNRAEAGPERLPPVEQPGAPDRSRPDVILITLDTTRADHLSAYGYQRDTSPRLAEFAAEAVRFDSAWAASSWTVPSHATLFTGEFPHTHGARYKTGQEHSEEPDVTSDRFHTLIRPLDPEQVTLAELLQSYGYRTGAFVAGPYMLADFGMAQGFEHYDDRMVVSVGPRLALYYVLDRLADRLLPGYQLEPDLVRFGHGYRRADEVTRAVFDWLDEHPQERVFLFINYFDAHYPYWPVREHRRRYPGWELDATGAMITQVYFAVMQGKRDLTEAERAWITSQYDAELRYQDEWLGRLFDRIKAEGRWDDALIIVTADHGEHLGERHGDDQVHLQHGFTVYAPVTHVPLLVKLPRSQSGGTTRSHPVHLADVVPTVRALLGLEPSAAVQGRDLFDEQQAHTVLSEIYRDDWRVRRFGPRWSRETHAWLQDGVRLHRLQPVDQDGRALGEAATELYDLDADPLEQEPLPADDRSEKALAALLRWLEQAPRYRPSRWILDWRPSAEAGAMLAGVGYVDSNDE